MVRIPEWLRFFALQMMRDKSALLLVCVLTVAAAWCGAASPILIGRIVDGVTLRDGAGLAALALLLLGTLTLAELVSSLRKYVSRRAMVRLTRDLTAETLGAVMHAPAAFFDRTPRGELLQRCVQDTRAIQQFGVYTVPGIVQDVLLAFVALRVICGVYWPVAVLLVAVYAVLFIPVHIYGRKRGDARRELNRHEAALRQSLLEKLESVKQIKIFGTERHEEETYRREQRRWAELTFREGVLAGMYKGFPRIPDALAPALVFLLVGWKTASGEATLGELVTILAFVPAVNAPVRSLFTMTAALADVKVKIEGLLVYSKLEPEPGRTPGLLKPDSIGDRPITFRGVSVRGERGLLLDAVTFTVKPGSHTAIVGASGAGKSTLLRLLVRMAEPASGDIRLGDEALSAIDAAWLRGKIGYVTQETFAFRDTLRANLNAFREAETAELDRWMAAFGADGFVNRLPDGYDATVGDRGSALSGGQRQLIGLVRTMVKRPELLLLDEATASLDQTSERIVHEALDRLCKGMTRISVTHRLEGARHADAIVVLHQGKIVEHGTHDELLCIPGGHYASLWHSERQPHPAAKEGEVSGHAVAVAR